METITLNNGIKMPRLGLGTYLIPKEKLSDIIGKAYKLGYRQFDTAWKYHNEKEIEAALKDNGIKREDVFITTKFSIYANCKSLWLGGHLFSFKFRSIESVIEEQLKELGTDYIDLYLMHWPYPQAISIWKTMIKYQEKGVLRSIGVCSFLPPHIEALEKATGVRPALNQFEISPLNTQKGLIKYCQDKGIAVEAMSTFSRYHSNSPRAEIIEDERILKIAKKYGKSSVQVVLRWMYQQNIILIPKTWEEAHLAENINILDFSLTEDEMQIIDGMNGGKFLNYNPYNATQGFRREFNIWKGF